MENSPKIRTLKCSLDLLIDNFGLPEIIDRLADICVEQANQDKESKEDWDKLTKLLEKATKESLKIANNS